MDAVVTCLDRTWGAHLGKAGMNFQKARVKHVNRIPRKYCDLDPGNEPSQILYCADDKTLYVQLGKDWLKSPGDLWLFHITAAVYAFHVQTLTGITAAYNDEPYRNRGELLEQARRYSLQSDCLAGAFLKSVWPLKGRSARDRRELASLIQGDQRGQERLTGSTANARAWLKRGLAAGDPKVCNTWTAPPRKVA